MCSAFCLYFSCFTDAESLPKVYKLRCDSKEDAEYVRLLWNSDLEVRVVDAVKLTHPWYFRQP